RSAHTASSSTVILCREGGNSAPSPAPSVSELVRLPMYKPPVRIMSGDMCIPETVSGDKEDTHVRTTRAPRVPSPLVCGRRLGGRAGGERRAGLAGWLGARTGGV